MRAQEKDKAAEALEIARKYGCKHIRITLGSNTQSSYSVRNNKTDRIQQAKSSSLFLQLFIDGRYGSFSTNRTSREELDSFINKASQATRLLSPDDNRILPDPSLYFTGEGEDLLQYDKNITTLTPSDKKDIAHNCSAEIFGSDPSIISVNSEYGDVEDYIYMIDSQGFEGETIQTSFSLSCESSVKGDGESRPEAWWYENSLFFDELIKERVGTKSLERAKARLNPRKLPSGKYNMVLENTVSSKIIAPIISALNGASIQQNNSFLKDAQGKKVFSSNFNLFDTPHLKKSFGARYFDGEGIATKPLKIIENGVVNTYFINTYYSRKLNMPVTIEGPSIPICRFGSPFTPGADKEKALNDILHECNNGILITGFNGGNSNTSTGDFSFGIEGFYFEKGVPLYPLKEMNITGNFISLWNNFISAGTDPRNTGRWLIPTLAFQNVNFSGI